MLATAAAMIMFTVMNALAKHLSETHSVIEIAFYRNVIAMIPFLAFALAFRRQQILRIRSRPGLILTRGIMGSVSLVATMAAFSVMPMAETAVLLFSSSLFIPILGVMMLSEKVGPYRWIAVLVGFVGVAVMANPSGNVNTFGVSMALLAASFQALMSVMLRQLGGSERPETVTFYFFLIGAVLTGLAVPFVAKPMLPGEWVWFVAIGAVGAIAQWCYSVGLKLTPAAVVAVLNYTTIIWATLAGWLIWNDWPTTLVLAGAAVVISANGLIVWREQRLGRVTLRQRP
ncbi:MAG: DMT family transporter [Pseudomonadota bacterium]